MMGGWVGQWVGSCQIIKNRVNSHLIEMIEFCLKIMIVETPPPMVCVCGVDGWVILWVSWWGHVKSLNIK